MSFWLLAGILTALVTGLIVTPLRKESRLLAAGLVLLLPLLALGTYFFIGNPGLAN